MSTHQVDVQAQIHFCPDSQHMTIAFAGGECTGMPPFSNELLDLARGALKVTFDLRELRMTNPESTVESILATLGRDESDPNTRILTPDSAPSNPLQGAYFAG